MYQFKILRTVPEMVQYVDLLRQLPAHDYDKEEYGRMLKEMIPNGYSQMAAFDGGNCIGIAGYWINTKLFTGKYAELDNVVIDREYRSRGIGAELCRKAEADAIEQGCRFMVLDCFLENNRAQKFYNDLGYTARGYHMIKKI